MSSTSLSFNQLLLLNVQSRNRLIIITCYVHTFVMVQVSLPSEGAGAELTLVWPLICMHCFVVFHVVFLSERLGTEGALEGLLSSVRPFVLHPVVFLLGAVGAEPTFIKPRLAPPATGCSQWAFCSPWSSAIQEKLHLKASLCVPLFVLSEVVLQTGRVAAEPALVGLLPSVGSHVSFQVLLLDEGVGAAPALVWSLPSVDPFMQ